MNTKNNQENNDNTVVQVNRYEFFQLRALCEEIMNSLCQAKALLEPVSEEDFFHRKDVEVLRHYFYAVDTIIDSALDAKDEITRVGSIDIIVIEDHEIFRKSIVMALSHSENMVVVGEADNGKDALTLMAEKNPDCVVLMDFHMPRGPGPDKVELIRQTKQSNPNSKLIIITGEQNPYLLSLILAAGENSLSIILKNDVHDEAYLIRVIQNTHQSAYCLPKGEELSYQIHAATAERNDFTNSLNDTEILATILLSDEHPLEDIAKELKKSPDYIRHVLHNAREKRGLKNNEELKQLYRKLFPIKYFVPKKRGQVST